MRSSALALWPSALVAVKVRTRRSQRHVVKRRNVVAASVGATSASCWAPSLIVTCTPGVERQAQIDVAPVTGVRSERERGLLSGGDARERAEES